MEAVRQQLLVATAALRRVRAQKQDLCAGGEQDAAGDLRSSVVRLDELGHGEPQPAAACAQCGGEPTHAEPGQAVNADAAEVITHCEWCGAEYPVPSGD